jgi:hypothetical protein
MTYALGFRVKSGYAIAVALAGSGGAPTALVRANVALSDPKIKETKQPYHDGFGTAQEDAAVIARLTSIVEKCAHASVRALLTSDHLAGGACRGAALVVGSVIDPAAVGNLHIRAHASEGRLFRTALEQALRANRVECSIIVDKRLAGEAAAKLRRPDADIKQLVGQLGRALGSPWRADEKAAATAAWIALG